MQHMRYQQSHPTQTHHEDGAHSDSEQIYDYHRELISMFLVPMCDIRIPKRKLRAFLDGVVDFVLSVKADDEILDSVLEPLQRMDVGVAEILCERLFLRANHSTFQLVSSEQFTVVSSLVSHSLHVYFTV